MRVPQFVVSWLRRVAIETIRARSPDKVIGHGEPYMLRWHLTKRRKWLGTVYLHCFLRDDNDRALHDHPWRSVSIAIGGRMHEVYAGRGADPKDPEQHSARYIRPGDMIFRGSNFSHRMELIDKGAFTIFIVGPDRREWGFWCPLGWMPWYEFDVAGCE